MNKQHYIILLMLLMSCFPFAMKAIHVPIDSFQTVEKKGRLKKIFQKNIHINVGADLEPTRNERIEQINFKSTLNVGIGYRFAINEHWALRPELGYQQFSTPRLSLITDIKDELDGARYHVTDTVSVLRMAGYNLGFLVERDLPFGLSVLAGAQCGWYKKGVKESGSLFTDAAGNRAINSTVGYDGNKELPRWFNRIQPGLKLGVEKKLFRRLVIGASVYQGFADLTDLPQSGKNFSTNYLGYVGVRL